VGTARAFPDRKVKPIPHRNWNGRKIVQPEDPAPVMDPALIPDLAWK
jgi:hypothetical protein